MSFITLSRTMSLSAFAGFFTFKKEGRSKGDTGGFTLVELLVVSGVFIGIIVAIWGVLLNSLNQVQVARELTIATDDLRDVMERIRSVPFSEMTVEFPDRGQVPGDVVGGYTLKDEVVTITYPLIEADRMEVRAEITWTDRNERAMSRIMRTVKVRML